MDVDFCFPPFFTSAQPEPPQRSNVDRVRDRSGVVDGGNDLHKVVKRALVVGSELPVQKAVDFHEREAQLRVVGKEVSVSIPEISHSLLHGERRNIKST